MGELVWTFGLEFANVQFFVVPFVDLTRGPNPPQKKHNTLGEQERAAHKVREMIGIWKFGRLLQAKTVRNVSGLDNDESLVLLWLLVSQSNEGEKKNCPRDLISCPLSCLDWGEEGSV